MKSDNKYFIIHMMVTEDDGKRTGNISQALFRLTADSLLTTAKNLIAETETLVTKHPITYLDVIATKELSVLKLEGNPKFISFDYLGVSHEIWYMPEQSVDIDGHFRPTRYSEWMNVTSRPFNDLPVAPEDLLLLSSFFQSSAVPQA